MSDIKYCCEELDFELLQRYQHHHQHDRKDCPDIAISIRKLGGDDWCCIRIGEKGDGWLTINYCPWCGESLSKFGF